MESQNPQIENRGVKNQSHLQEKVPQGPTTQGIAIGDMIDNIVGTGTRNGCIDDNHSCNMTQNRDDWLLADEFKGKYDVKLDEIEY